MGGEMQMQAGSFSKRHVAMTAILAAAISIWFFSFMAIGHSSVDTHAFPLFFNKEGYQTGFATLAPSGEWEACGKAKRLPPSSLMFEMQSGDATCSYRLFNRTDAQKCLQG